MRNAGNPQNGREVPDLAAQFDDLTLIKRHRLVYAALGELMNTDIHALGIEAIAPCEQQP